MTTRLLIFCAALTQPLLAADPLPVDPSAAEAKSFQRRIEWIEQDQTPPKDLAEFFRVPEKLQADDSYDSPLVFADGHRVETASQWQARRAEILKTWGDVMGQWPALIESPRVEVVKTTRRGNVTQKQMRIEIGVGGEMVNAFLLIPDGEGPFPAVLVTYYEAQSGVGLGTELRDFGWHLAKRGFVSLSIGKPDAGVNLDNPEQIPGRRTKYYGPAGDEVRVQPLSALAYSSANAHTVLAQRPDVFPDRIGIVGHSFGGKWAMFASCLYDKFDCAVWSDPGIVFDERNRRKKNAKGSVNYWDEWYLGFELGSKPSTGNGRWRKLPSEGEPRTGSYKRLIESGHDLHELHALMAPRPFLVSGGTADLPERWAALNQTIAVNRILGFDNRVGMTNRAPHAPMEASNEQIYRFFQWWLHENSVGTN